MSNLIPTESLKFTEARPKLSSILDRVFQRKMRVRLYKGTTPIAAIVSIADLEQLEKWDRERQARFDELVRLSQPFADIPPEELEEEIARAITEVRAERSAMVG